MGPTAVLLFLACAAHVASAGEYTDRFLQQYHKMKDPSNGYFSKEGIPYHSVETLIVEAPDYGHETTSEAFSYFLWIEAMYGKIANNFSSFNAAWGTMDNYIIPTYQPTGNYHTYAPATYAPEKDLPSDYPSWMEFNTPVGNDPIYDELVAAYGGDTTMYSMHWLLDVDNVYGFGETQGNCQGGPSVDGPSYINTFQRGPMESVWRTIPQPTCDDFSSGGPNGFLDLFVGDNSYTRQWKYTAAPDADARAVQAAYWAKVWADEAGQLSTITDTLAKAGKMGDYLRYSMFDKYFKKVGECIGPNVCPGGQGKESCHYLISWYFAWGGAMDYAWSWRIGDGTAHFGYQNPLAAYVLSTDDLIKPLSATAQEDWKLSLARQIELYDWLQSDEGAFAGGVTNSVNGRYDTPTANLTNNTFHGMYYQWEPVYHDPPSNRWFGMQAWSTDRLAQYYYVTKDATVEPILTKWVNWVLDEIKFNDDGTVYQIPANLEWTGVPPNVDVKVTQYTYDTGTASALARALTYYAAATNSDNVKAVAKQLLDDIWNYQTDLGVSTEEIMDTYSQFSEPVYVPPGWIGKYPNGDIIESGINFTDIRSFYKQDPSWPKIEEYLNGGSLPAFVYHRFWAQSEVALAQGAYGILFNE